MALVDGFLELERSSGKLEWSAILQKMASDLGFSKILFGLLPKDSQDYENAFIVGNYPAAWREHYDRAGYARVDPTVSHCTDSVEKVALAAASRSDVPAVEVAASH
ncbi:autoinducer binding domain-containing protein, partial [Pseudomonas aeruginosa]